MVKGNLIWNGDVGCPSMSKDLDMSEEEMVPPGKLDPHSVGSWKRNCDREYREN